MITYNGIGFELTASGDPIQDMLAVTGAIMRGDEDARNAALARSDLEQLAESACAVIAAIALAAAGQGDPDAPVTPSPLGEHHVLAAEAFLRAALSTPGEAEIYAGLPS